ncbi:DUF6101 family protein [Methylocystis parvus]|uniref:Uncharacterized protein n=1 Tax=Methylocystis parvus TaxID=134 RepID=A0A6B8M6V6_9HYPH|nr:DUF6101 family protein [Methylocystis parvus]QGM98228.1 hypothetical protein F7D14_12595 [Methylocystis parvus]WBK01444.1 DUF6101 family protein [Methylocystis parvus OBBP]
MFEATNARKTEEAVLVQRDWRADGGARRVRVTRSDILISRRFSGVDMMIAVPVPAYDGVALDVVEGRDGAPCYRLSLAHRDRDLDVVLGETQDCGDAAADWKYWASWLGLPRLANEDGELAQVDAPGAPLQGYPRRGASPLRNRRPRFLTRRKAGDAARMAEIFAGEREIVCYE